MAINQEQQESDTKSVNTADIKKLLEEIKDSYYNIRMALYDELKIIDRKIRRLDKFEK